MSRRPLLIVALLIVILAGGVGTFWWYAGAGVDSTTPVPGTVIGGPFTLTDDTGRTVTERSWPGKYLLIYFGYTSCPDVCPTDLQTIAKALDELGGKADAIQPLFVTIDPVRDTPGQMAAYVKAFTPRLRGLTGTPTQIRAMAKAYRVYYAKHPDPGGNGSDYSMDHSAFIYLMAPDGHFDTIYPGTTSPDMLATDLAKRIKG